MQFKLGEWYESDGGYIVQVTEKIETLDGIKYTITYNDDSTNLIDEGSNRFKLVHLPNCTGYDLKPLEIPDGYRKLEIGEVPVEGDLWSQDGFKPFETLNQASYMVYTKKQIPPMNERVPRGQGCGEYDPGAIWARKVEKWVPFTFDTCPAMIKVINKYTKRKYVAYAFDEGSINIGTSYVLFKEFFDLYTDLNGGPLGTTE